MTDQVHLTPQRIRAERQDNPKLRDRDLAQRLGIAEAQLVAAHCGRGVTRIAADPDRLMPRLADLGEVMALTRNRSCVIEKIGRYDNYQSGQHAAMVLTREIDLRLFPAHWVTGFAVERETDHGIRRSLQIFDAAGDAVHKVFLREGADLEAWARLVSDLALAEQAETLQVAPRAPVEAPRADPAKAERLRAEWAGLTDTHQFLRMVSRLKMNRLGAYRIAGAPLARPLARDVSASLLEQIRDQGIEVMIFVGNRGCIEIHGGPVASVKPMGPWLNVLDPGFNLHLRADHVAEIWAVEKPTQRGPAVSVEAFDADGALIYQIFGRRFETEDHRGAWNRLVAGLPALNPAEVA